jgi:hypothetical protein
MKPKNCTLVIGRVIYLRKQCEGMVLSTADNIIRGYANDVKSILEKYIPSDVTLTLDKDPRLLLGSVEMCIVALKDGKHYPAHYWVGPEVWKELEKNYRVRSQ